MKELITENLIIRPFIIDDAPFILELVNNPTWIEFIGDKEIHNLKDAENYLINGPLLSYTNNGHGLYHLSLKSNHEPIGTAGLIKRPTLENVDIGFAILPKFANKGYGFEASKKILDYGKEILGINKVVAITMENNINSINLLTKLGLEFIEKIKLDANKEETLLLYGIEY